MMLLKKISAFVISCGMALLCALPCYAEEEKGVPEILSGKSAIVTECSTGQVLFEHNSSERLAMASVTKLMCMLIWAEEIEAGRLHFDDIVRCSAFASSRDGSVIWLMPNEEMSVRDLIKSVVIASANDAATALCEHIAGSERDFVRLMNDKAKSLGMTNTQYKNCVGYDEEGHYTTAYDIALLCGEVSKYDYYNEFFNTRLDYVREGDKAAQLLNTNKLMRYYNGIIGGKTGTTDNAGYCLAVWAKRGNMTICAVVLGCKEENDRFDACENLLDYGFDGFEIYKAEVDASKLIPVEVDNGLKKNTDVRIKRLVSMVIPKGCKEDIKYSYEIVEKLTAPVVCGQTVGRVTAVLYDEVIFESDIIAVYEVEETTFFSAFLIILSGIFSF
ncbi:MAG: D-alanyl-D-alanine carboxypeptidase [Ruminiclostridium sp.]|nr:D-alanyl-D-alanine carboxypeptidase [Ruminiclostridium sp.]